MLRIVVALFCGLVLTACSNGGGGESSDSKPKNKFFSVKYKSNKVVGSNAVLMSADNPVPLLFGTIGVSLLSYRPNQSLQLGNRESYSADWSHWEMLPYGSSGDFILPSGGKVDLRTLPTSNAGGNFFNEIGDVDNSDQFVDDVGALTVDAVYVQAMPSIINTLKQVCGIGYLSWRDETDFPTLDFSSNCLGRVIKSSYDGSLLSDMKVIFIRKDWFDVPVQVYPVYDDNSELECYSTDVALDAFQIEIFDSLMNVQLKGEWPNGKYSASTCALNPSRTDYPFSIVPQTGDVPVIQFTKYSIPVEPEITPEGNSIPQPDDILIGANIEATISFDLRPSLFVDADSVNDPNDTSDILIDRTADNLPFGLSITFEAVEEAVLH